MYVAFLVFSCKGPIQAGGVARGGQLVPSKKKNSPPSLPMTGVAFWRWLFKETRMWKSEEYLTRRERQEKVGGEEYLAFLISLDFAFWPC